MERGRLLRTGTIDEVTAAEAPARTITMRWVGAAESSVRAILARGPDVSHVEFVGKTAQFYYTGPEEGQAQLLNDLLSAQVQVVAFSEVKTTVEDLYMKLSHHEVM